MGQPEISGGVIDRHDGVGEFGQALYQLGALAIGSSLDVLVLVPLEAKLYIRIARFVNIIAST